MPVVKGFKAFGPNMKCRDFQFKVGKTYKHKDEVELCKFGFHFCRRAQDVFNYYTFDPTNIVCEVEARGTVKHGDDKSVCSELKVLKQLTWAEVLEIANSGKNNTGHSNSGSSNSGSSNSGSSNSGSSNSGSSNSGSSNSGSSNSGDWNSGSSNSGDWNSGSSNSGSSNSGDWNSGDWNSGFFNTNSPNVRLFNKQTNIPLSDPRIQAVRRLGPDLHQRICFSSMTAEEKKAWPEAQTTDGYLKRLDYKQAWKYWWPTTNQETRDKFLRLPFFDPKIFEEITGVKVTKGEVKKVLKKK